MEIKKSKRIFAWIILFILIGLALSLTYLKFFSTDNNNLQEQPINNSSSNSIHKALKNITSNFNKNPKIKTYADNGIVLKASVNNYSIYISYITDTTITYEFTYNDLWLNITVNNNHQEQEKFDIIYQLLIEAVQERINNTENLDTTITSFLTTDVNYDGLIKKETQNGIEYQMNITKKLKAF